MEPQEIIVLQENRVPGRLIMAFRSKYETDSESEEEAGKMLYTIKELMYNNI